jgi:hypothetical protein
VSLAVPCPSDAAPHSALRSPSKSRADHERPHTADWRTDLFVTHCCAPHRHRGATESPQPVATHGCRRDTALGGAVALGVPHPLTGDGCSLGTVVSHCATRRCRTPPGTASPDAVPQMRACRSPSPRVACSAIPIAWMVKHAEQNSLLDIRNSKRKGVVSDYPWGTRADQTGERATAPGNGEPSASADGKGSLGKI